MSGIYGEHEIQERHQKFDEKAEKAMDKPKWHDKRKSVQFNHICKACKLQNRIDAVKKEDAESKEEGDTAEKDTAEEASQEEAEPTEKTMKIVVWKNGEKETPVLEM